MSVNAIAGTQAFALGHAMPTGAGALQLHAAVQALRGLATAGVARNPILLRTTELYTTLAGDLKGEGITMMLQVCRLLAEAFLASPRSAVAAGLRAGSCDLASHGLRPGSANAVLAFDVFQSCVSKQLDHAKFLARPSASVRLDRRRCHRNRGWMSP